MIPNLKQKIWYAFQGLPVERIGSTDYLPWSKCLVLTNNLMYILNFSQLTDTFKRHINKPNQVSHTGVTYEEYIQVFDKYFEEKYKIPIFASNKPINSLEFESVTLTEYNQSQRVTTQDSRTNVFRKITFNTYCKSNADISPRIKSFDDYCWTLFRTKTMPNIGQTILDDGYFDLWLLFIAFSVMDPVTGEVDIPVRMDLVEATYWCLRIREMLGTRRQFDDTEIEEKVTYISYQEFFAMFEQIFRTVSLAESVVEITLRELTEEALEGVTMKGPIKIDRYTRYCVLKSYLLMIYNNKEGAVNFRSCFLISKDTELLAGTNKIIMKTPGLDQTTLITIEITDNQSFNKWRSAFTDAIEFSKSNILNPAIAEAKKRGLVRDAKRSAIRDKRILMEIKIEEERSERCKLTKVMEHQLLLADQKLDNFKEEMTKELEAKKILMQQNEEIRQETEAHIKQILNAQQTQYQLQLDQLKEIEMEKHSLNEKLQATMEQKSSEESKRVKLEGKHLEAQKLLQQAGEKINSLQELRDQLEKALEDERQAKEEEEALRMATLTLLDEEQQSKLNLEKLLVQQNSVIDQEIQKRDQFSQELQNERNRIRNIAEEKEKLSKQIEETRHKMESTGNRVKGLDTKVSKIIENVFGKEQLTIPSSHRGRGFIADVKLRKGDPNGH